MLRPLEGINPLRVNRCKASIGSCQPRLMERRSTPRMALFINEDLITATLAGIEGGAQRWEILVRPDWATPLKYYRYPDVRISTLSPWAFVPETSEITLPGGRRGTLHTVSRTISAKQTVFVSFSDVSKNADAQRLAWPDPAGTAIRNVQASLRSVGATGPVPHAETWRGYISATGSGSASDSDGIVHASIRNVYLPDQKGFLTFMGVSQVSLLDSQSLLDQLEVQTQVLR